MKRPPPSSTLFPYATLFRSNGCTSVDSAAVDVTVNALPVTTISPAGPQAICAGTSVSLTASAGVSWLWSDGAITQRISHDCTRGTAEPGTDANGCTSMDSAA